MKPKLVPRAGRRQTEQHLAASTAVGIGPVAAGPPKVGVRQRLSSWLRRLGGVADDWQLWRRARAGDADAATELVHRLTPQALALAMQLLRQRADAEDVVQESFLRLWRAQPSDQHNASFATYFNTIVLNRCRSVLVRQREVTLDPQDLTALSDATQHSPPTDLVADQQRLQLRAVLLSLPARQRVALTMWAYTDATAADIARALDIDTNAAHQLLHRARQTLKQRFLADQDPS